MLEIQKEQIPERGALPGQLQVVRVPGRTVKDQIGEDTLLLLPEVLGSAPGKLRGHAAARLSFDSVEDAAADLVQPHLTYTVSEFSGDFQAAVGTLIIACGILVLALVAQSLGARLEIIGTARQVPGDLQVMADHGAVLLPAIAEVGRPVGVEPLVHEVGLRVRELLADQRGSLLD